AGVAGRARAHARVGRDAARPSRPIVSGTRSPQRRMSAVPFSLRRTCLIAQNTVREAARQKLFNFLLVLALALVLGARWLRDFNFGAPELKFLADCGFGAMAFFGAALTLTATA